MTEQLDTAIPQFTICDRLRKAREKTGLDQGPFADAIGVSRGTVSRYERDETSPFKKVVLMGWAMRSGVPLKWLETGDIPGDDGGGESRGLGLRV